MKKKPDIQQILSFVFLLVALGVVLYIGLSQNDMDHLLAALKSLSPAYLLLCLLSWALYVLSEVYKKRGDRKRVAATDELLARAWVGDRGGLSMQKL